MSKICKSCNFVFRRSLLSVSALLQMQTPPSNPSSFQEGESMNLLGFFCFEDLFVRSTH